MPLQEEKLRFWCAIEGGIGFIGVCSLLTDTFKKKKKFVFPLFGSAADFSYFGGVKMLC